MRHALHSPEPRDAFGGVDWLVGLRHRQVATGRFFGVTACPLEPSQKIRRLTPDSAEIPLAVRNLHIARDLPCPLRLFVFDMKTDEGFYRWLIAPETDSVKNISQTFFRRLTNNALSDIIAAVNGWYESRLQLSA
jgi:hypothetical protein